MEGDPHDRPIPLQEPVLSEQTALSQEPVPVEEQLLEEDPALVEAPPPLTPEEIRRKAAIQKEIERSNRLAEKKRRDSEFFKAKALEKSISTSKPTSSSSSPGAVAVQAGTLNSPDRRVVGEGKPLHDEVTLAIQAQTKGHEAKFDAFRCKTIQTKSDPGLQTTTTIAATTKSHPRVLFEFACSPKSSIGKSRRILGLLVSGCRLNNAT